MALTDECSVAGVVRAHAQAKQSGLQLLPGAVFRLQPSPALLPTTVGGEMGVAVGVAMGREPEGAGAGEVSHPVDRCAPESATAHALTNANGWRMVVLPRHLSGWGRLCQYITTARGAAPQGVVRGHTACPRQPRPGGVRNHPATTPCVGIWWGV